MKISKYYISLDTTQDSIILFNKNTFKFEKEITIKNLENWMYAIYDHKCIAVIKINGTYYIKMINI
jgi:hypothetical protein